MRKRIKVNLEKTAGGIRILLQHVAIAIAIFLLLMRSIHAFEITEEMVGGAPKNLVNDALILHDPNDQLNAEAAIDRFSHPEFVSDKTTPAGKQYWFYSRLINRSSHSEWSLRSNNMLYDDYEFYLYCKNQFLHSIPRPLLGIDSPTLASSYFIAVSLPQNVECGFLQRVRVAILHPPKIYLMTQAVATEQSNGNTILNLIGVGVILGLIIYNFLLYVSIKNSIYLIYTIYAILHLIFMLLLIWRPLIITDLFEESLHALRVVSASTMAFFILFTIKFMQPGIEAARKKPDKQRVSRIASALVLASYLPVLLMFVFALHAIFLPERLGDTAKYSLFYIASSLFIPFISLVVGLGGYKQAWVFLPAWTILVASHILGTLYIIGVVELYGWERTQMILAAALEMTLLSIALGINLKESHLARDRARMAHAKAEFLVERQEKFISTLSHEIRTPLHAMLGATNLLGHTALSDKQQRYWSTIHYAAESMYALVDNLLDRTQLKNARTFDKNSEFDPQRLLEAMIQLLRPRAEEKNLQMHLHTTDLPARLVGKPVIIRRVLINLISNATKYTDTGKISVSVKWLADTHELHLAVADTGRGISAEQLAHVEENFNVGVESLYSQNSSSGLGLPICFEMIKSAGGNLQLESKLGKGTKASFTLAMDLPIVFDNEPTPDLNQNTALSVLVVDDVISNRLIASELLTSAGHTVSQAGGGEQALVLCEQQRFDVIISDVRMPKLDGIQLLQELRQKYNAEDLIIIMTSAHFDQKQRDTLLSMGANTCLAKPYTPTELFTLIQGAGGAAENTEKHSADDAFEHLKQSLGEEKTSQILALYKDQLDEDLSRIILAGSNHDAQTIRVAAHRIVSASRALGLHKNAEAAWQIETYEENQPTINWEDFNQQISRHLSTIRA